MQNIGQTLQSGRIIFEDIDITISRDEFNAWIKEQKFEDESQHLLDSGIGKIDLSETWIWSEDTLYPIHIPGQFASPHINVRNNAGEGVGYFGSSDIADLGHVKVEIFPELTDELHIDIEDISRYVIEKKLLLVDV